MVSSFCYKADGSSDSGISTSVSPVLGAERRAGQSWEEEQAVFSLPSSFLPVQHSCINNLAMVFIGMHGCCTGRREEGGREHSSHSQVPPSPPPAPPCY